MPALISHLILAGGGGASDHAALTGLADDDHTQYQKESEKDQDGGYVGRDANGLVTASGGGVQFPATQVPSADANALDDYEEGTWTPALTFAVPGDLNIVYDVQVASYTKLGRLVTVIFSIETSTFTHTTASGLMRVTGLPFTAANIAGLSQPGTLAWAGVTKANYSQIVVLAESNTTNLFTNMSGSGQAFANLTAADMPTGGTVFLRGQVTYIAA